MITVFVCLVFGVAAFAAAGNGEWGAAAIGAVIIVAAILLHYSLAQDGRAYVNFRDYWAAGGPDRKKAVRRQTRTDVWREREEDECAKASYRAIMDEVDRKTGARSSEGTFVCHYCGRYVRAASETAYTASGRMRTYRCPICGRQNVTKI